MTLSMSEIERVKAAIKRCETKRDAMTDPLSRRYYELCLVGWRDWLAKLERVSVEPTRADLHASEIV